MIVPLTVREILEEQLAKKLAKGDNHLRVMPAKEGIRSIVTEAEGRFRLSAFRNEEKTAACLQRPALTLEWRQEMMKTIASQSFFNPGKFNNYLIGGNVCNAFGVGEIGSMDDFFLVGAEPRDESNYPLLTGNILDSEGKLLFRLVRNVLVVNPGHCSRILSDHVGYEIHDGNHKPILKVRTVFEKLPGLPEKTFVTSISANCYNRKGELVFRTGSETGEDQMEINVKCALGFSGGFAFVRGLTKEEEIFLAIVLRSGGGIHQLLTGAIANQEITLDGKALVNATLTKCRVAICSADFALFGINTLKECDIKLSGPAENIFHMLQNRSQAKGPS